MDGHVPLWTPSPFPCSLAAVQVSVGDEMLTADLFPVEVLSTAPHRHLS